MAQSARELFRYRFPRFAAVLDDAEEEEVTSAIVTKGRLYAGRHLLAPGAAPGERGFRVALFRGAGPARAALYGAALPLDLLPRLPGVEIRRASRVRLAAAPAIPVPVQADGDRAGLLPVEIEDAPGPLRVMLPPVPDRGVEARTSRLVGRPAVGGGRCSGGPHPIAVEAWTVVRARGGPTASAQSAGAPRRFGGAARLARQKL